MSRSRLRPKTVKAIGEMVGIAAVSLGADPDKPIEFTICGASWCGTGEPDTEDMTVEDLLGDFSELDAGQHPPEYPKLEHE